MLNYCACAYLIFKPGTRHACVRRYIWIYNGHQTSSSHHHHHHDPYKDSWCKGTKLCNSQLLEKWKYLHHQLQENYDFLILNVSARCRLVLKFKSLTLLKFKLIDLKWTPFPNTEKGMIYFMIVGKLNRSPFFCAIVARMSTCQAYSMQNLISSLRRDMLSNSMKSRC